MSSKSLFFSLFIVFIAIIFSLLFAYKTTLLVYPMTEMQHQVISQLKYSNDIFSVYSPLGINFTLAELSHLNDVKWVMFFADILFGLSTLGIAILLGYSWNNKPLLRKISGLAGRGILIFNGIMLVSALLLFNQVFTLFHTLLFPQGNWIFPSDSLLIQTFPENFFVSIAAIIFILGVVIGSIFIAVQLITEKYGSKQKN